MTSLSPVFNQQGHLIAIAEPVVPRTYQPVLVLEPHARIQHSTSVNFRIRNALLLLGLLLLRLLGGRRLLLLLLLPWLLSGSLFLGGSSRCRRLSLRRRLSRLLRQSDWRAHLGRWLRQRARLLSGRRRLRRSGGRWLPWLRL